VVQAGTFRIGSRYKNTFVYALQRLCYTDRTYRQGLWQGGKSGYRPNLQKIVKEIWGVFVFLFLGGARFCLRQETEV